ncbi:MAG: hypothetical protein JO288_02305 [Hyphomicrobiales bacterium]|nr:hypothetical protein [Hyphomicrobiales bacterium]
MDEEKSRKQRTTKFSRAARTKRIVDRAREGCSYDEIARVEQLTERSVYRIVTQALKGHQALEKTNPRAHADRPGGPGAEGRGRCPQPRRHPSDRAVPLDRYQSLAGEL